MIIKKFIVGKIVTPGDVKELVLAIKELFLLPTSKKEVLRKKALQVAMKYSWQRNVNMRLKYYKKVIS